MSKKKRVRVHIY